MNVTQSHLLVNLNDLIFERSQAFRERGVPVIAGTILIDSLYEFQLDAPCLWLLINENGSGHELTIDVTSPVIDSQMVNVMKPEDFKILVDEQC